MKVQVVPSHGWVNWITLLRHSSTSAPCADALYCAPRSTIALHLVALWNTQAVAFFNIVNRLKGIPLEVKGDPSISEHLLH